MDLKEKRRLLYHSLFACLPIMEGDRQLMVNDIADKLMFEVERWEVENNVFLADAGSCNYYTPDKTTAMNCRTCGKNKSNHNFTVII